MLIYNLPLKEAREKFERWYLIEQIIKHRGKIGEIASEIGMERTYLWRKMIKLGLLETIKNVRLGGTVQNYPLIVSYSPSEHESTFTRNQQKTTLAAE